MATFSKNGKRIGRPPKAQTQQPTGDAGAKTRNILNRYDAAGRGRRLAGWNPPSSGPNVALAGLQTIRDRSRDSVRNDWAGESVVQKWVSNLIGVGIRPRFKRIKDKARKQRINDLFDDFTKQCDADGVLDFYGQQGLVTRAWLDGGEAFARRRRRFPDEGFAVPMQVQLLEADMLAPLDADQYQALPTGHVIRSGIELNKRGRRIAYWFYKQHPGDQQAANVGPDNLVRVLASDVAHIYEPKRPGQLRGVPTMAPVLVRQRNIADYEDATLERQKIANLFVGFIKRTAPQLDPSDPAIAELTGAVVDYMLGEPNPLLPLKPGLIQTLDENEDVQFANPPEAGTTYSDYMRTSHLGTAAGTGLPYELMSGDIREISDRTLRVLINDFRRYAEQRQWQIVIPMFCQKVFDWFVEAAVLAGEISPTEAEDVRRAEWAPHGWEYIHPVQDPQGKKLEVEAGFRSRSSVIGARGDDPDEVDDERAADMQREKELGLWVDLFGGQGGGSTEEGDMDGLDNDEYSAPPNVAARTR